MEKRILGEDAEGGLPSEVERRGRGGKRRLASSRPAGGGGCRAGLGPEELAVVAAAAPAQQRVSSTFLSPNGRGAAAGPGLVKGGGRWS